MNQAQILKLLRSYGNVMNKLRDAGVLRSSNGPVADYAEYLVAKKFKLTLTPNSNKSYDAVNTKTKIKYQIKSRRITRFNNSRQLSVIRSRNFDFLVAVIFAEDFSVQEAYRIPERIIRSPYVRFSKHQNGDILILRGNILKNKSVKKIKL